MSNIKNVEKYWNDRPCNIRHSFKKIGTKEYFDEVERRKFFVEPHIPEFAQYPKWANKKVLEIGCGIGTETVNFANSGARITAVDLSSNSLSLARKRAEIYNLSNIDFYHANVEELSTIVPIQKYDLIYSFGVLHHTPNPRKAFLELKKYMNSDSKLKVMLYHKFSWKVFWVILKYGLKYGFPISKKLDELIAHYSEAQIGCPVTYAYSKNDARKLLRSCGFNVLNISIDHIFPYSIPEYKKHEYKKYWYFKILPYRVFKYLENIFGWHLLIEAELAQE